MLTQIARNKRRSVVVIILFILVWTGIGALLGLILGGGSQTTCDAYGYCYRTAVPGINTASVITGMVVAAMLAVLATIWALTAGHNLVLAVSGAQPADPVQYQQLHDVVEALAIGDGIPKPAVYVIDDPSPNAFATGTSPKRAAITATTGLLQIMNREELEGVIGHEMSHIKNYDVRLLLVVSTLIGLAAVIASIIWRSAFYMRPRGRDSGQLMLVILVAGILMSIVAVIVGPIMQFALSRSREELADVSGAELTRNPVGLMHALQKLQQNDKPFAKFNHATAAMCIDDPLQHHESWFHHLFDTHPPLEQRIAILQQIAEGRQI